MAFPNWIVGVLLACLASVISNLGLNLQKLNHLRNDRAQSIAASASVSARPQSTAPSPYFPPYTISRSPSPTHKSFAFFRSSPPIPLQLKRSTAPHLSYQSMESPSAFNSSPPPKLSISPRALSASSSPTHPLLPAPRPPSTSDPTTPPPHLPSHPSPISYHLQSLWRLGLSLVVLGSIADFIALIFAAQSIIAPLGSLTLVSNTVLAPFLLKESVTPFDVLATVAIVIGSSLSVACADHRDRMYGMEELFELFLRPRFVLYVVVMTAVLLVLWSYIGHIQRVQEEAPAVVYRAYRRHHRFCYAALAGMVGAQSVLLAKCVGTLLVSTLSGDSVLFFHWQSYAIFTLLSLAVTAQIHYLNEGLRLFTSTYIIPVYQSFWILTSVLSGMVFFGEWKGVFDEAGTGFGFPLGVLITVAGVYVLSQRGGEAELEDNEDASGSLSAAEGEEASEGQQGMRVGTRGAPRLTRASTQPIAGEQIATFPSASSSSFFVLGFDARRGGRMLSGIRVWDDELHTAPVQSSSSMYLPLSSSLPSTSLVPEAEEVKEEGERAEKKRDRERRNGALAGG